MFPEIHHAADAIDEALLINEDEAALLSETAQTYESLPGGYGIAVALRGIVREVGLHAEAMRTQLQAVRAACDKTGEGGGAAHR
ncbi:hypothetical protein [Methylobacterium sp. E-046]|uniref:hypothetical protein n=1 Tax=Methylobacterium sp. E-046 TaxID=2836576 RepID=UPI001FB9FE81|nr:hypothetical protein [Methylobacterium sp. E-046]MCJ2098901.1 hypothetical protein [Methylobacterium sp. E-046]